MAVTITTPTFENRVVEHPSRYTLTNVSGSTYDLARDEGTVTTAGTPQNEATFNKIKDDLDAIKINIDYIETNGIIGTTEFGAITVTDLNAISKCGFYECNNSATGVPPVVVGSSKWLVLHQNNNTSGTDNKYQRATALAPDAITYERTSVAGWNNWKLVPNDARITTAETDIDNLQTGWNPAGETWTYASVDDPTGNITISGDKTTKYSLGMRIKFTNGGNTIFGIVTKIAYSSPNTTLTFLHEIDPTDSLALHLMADSAITDNYASCSKSPCGFAIDEEKWSLIVIDTTDKSQSTPAGGTWYNLGGLNIIVPIGNWKLRYKVIVQNGASGSIVDRYFKTTFSTTNNSQTIAKFTCAIAIPAVKFLRNTFILEDTYLATAKTPIYLNSMSETAVDVISNNGSAGATILKAVCTYL